MNVVKNIVLMSALFYCSSATAQQEVDTTAILKTFNKVTAFATRPVLSYTLSTKLQSEPVLDAADTFQVSGQFFKLNSDCYYGSSRDETFLQDSLLIQINHQRKTIWFSKVDVASKEKYSQQVMGTRQLQQYLAGKYSVQKTETDKNLHQISFVSLKQNDSITTTQTTFSVAYHPKNYSINYLDTRIEMKQPLSDELLAALQADNIADTKLIQVVNGQRFLIRSQQMSMFFSAIDYSEKTAEQMPRWTSFFTYDEVNDTYIADKKYQDYEITKTF